MKKSSRIASIAFSAVLLLAFGGIVWTSVGPPMSIERMECVLLSEVETHQSRRSISHSVETSCGKLSVNGAERWRYNSAEIGKTYTFTVAHRMFSSRVIDFESNTKRPSQ